MWILQVAGIALAVYCGLAMLLFFFCLNKGQACKLAGIFCTPLAYALVTLVIIWDDVTEWWDRPPMDD